jgi:hypothetical protein
MYHHLLLLCQQKLTLLVAHQLYLIRLLLLPQMPQPLALAMPLVLLPDSFFDNCSAFALALALAATIASLLE